MAVVGCGIGQKCRDKHSILRYSNFLKEHWPRLGTKSVLYHSPIHSLRYKHGFAGR